MLNKRPFFITGFTAMFSFIVLSVGSIALAGKPEIDAAKTICTVGEQTDGYLGFPKAGATPELVREVNAVNLQRRAVYTKLAQKNNVSVDMAAQVTAETLITRMPVGQCYKDTNGVWQTK